MRQDSRLLLSVSKQLGTNSNYKENSDRDIVRSDQITEFANIKIGLNLRQMK